MNYYQARQRKSDLLWHYTCQNDNNIWPVGYCTDEWQCAGHSTPEAAVAHFRDWVLDTASFDGRSSNAQRHCEVCGVWTDRIAQGGIGNTDMHFLCDEHCNREGLDKVLPEQSVIIASW